MSTLVAQTISNGTVSTSSANVIQGSARAWVNFNAQTNAIRSSYNVSSITNNGSGFMQVNFTNAFANTNYIPIAWGSNDGATRGNPQFDGNNNTTAGQLTTTYIRYYYGAYSSGATFNTQFQWLVVFSA